MNRRRFMKTAAGAIGAVAVAPVAGSQLVHFVEEWLPNTWSHSVGEIFGLPVFVSDIDIWDVGSLLSFEGREVE